MDYTLALEQFGLNKKEIKIYTTLLQMGSGTIQEIVRKTKIKRTTTYSVLENLMQKNLVVLVEKGKKREYFVEDPKKIISLLESKEKDLSEKKKRLIEALPEIKSLYNIHAKKPKIRFFEGEKAIKQAFEESLDLPKGSEILACYTTEELIKMFMNDYITSYIDQRIAKGITQRAIAEDSKFLEDFQKKDKKQLRNLVLVNPKKFPFTDQISIYGNKMFIASFKDLIAIIIESEPVVNTYRSLFELAWAEAQKLGKKSQNPYIPPKKSARG
ncbi:MAG: helix-turn-helix domain-containing protein [bacterium]